MTTIGQYGFPMMAEIIPEGKIGDWGIRHRVMTPEEVKHEKGIAIIRRDWTCNGLQPGTYATLYWGNGHRGEIMMSDTWLERWTNREAVTKANGHVLIAGLGIGLIIVPICAKPEVQSVTVIENTPEVVHLVSPHIAHPKLSVIQDDIFTWQPAQQYDTIYFDIWATISADNYPETVLLHRRYSKLLNHQNSAAWMGSWLRDEFKRLQQRG